MWIIQTAVNTCSCTSADVHQSCTIESVSTAIEMIRLGFCFERRVDSDGVFEFGRAPVWLSWKVDIELADIQFLCMNTSLVVSKLQLAREHN